MRALIALPFMVKQQHIPVLVEALHDPALVVGEYRDHSVLRRNSRSGAENGNGVDGIRGAGSKHSLEDMSLVANVVEAAVHYHQVVPVHL
jgi:hypothetical protein